jgi:3D (Asp-Asp-Asp) domain-containing protein
MKILKSRFVVTLLTVITIFGLESPVLNTRADGEAVPKMNEYDPIYVETHSLLEDRLEEYLRQEESKKASAKSIAEEYAAKDIESQNRKDEIYNEIQERKPKKTFVGSYELTAYIATGNPCASGVYPTCNHTVACNSLPLGTRVYIEGYGEYVVEDTGGMAGNVIDVFVSDYSTAINFGRRVADVYVIQ